MNIINIAYLLTLIFVLAVIFMKIMKKEEIHRIWFWILGVQVIIIPILYFLIFGFFTSSIMETINIHK
jgi:hypothetical protein